MMMDCRPGGVNELLRAGGGRPPGGAPARIRARRPGDPFLPSDEWMAATPVNAGSWWTAWSQWLADRSGTPEAPPPLGIPGRPALGDAPGRYVLET